MSNMLLLVDGSSLLCSSFYGSVPKDYLKADTDEKRAKVLSELLQTSDGKYYTNGVHSFLRTLFKILKDFEPSHLSIAWDITDDTFRRKLYPKYKAQRKPFPPELQLQFGLMRKLLPYIGISSYAFEDFEADDIIGTLSKKFEEQIPVYILSKDADVLQLVSKNTKVWQINPEAKYIYKSLGIDIRTIKVPNKVIEYDEDMVQRMYNLLPAQIIDLKALNGDSSDNIPGVKGIGKVSAPILIQQYDSVENLYKYVESLDKNEELRFKEDMKALGIRSPLTYLLKESTEDELLGKDAAMMSKKLATIIRDMSDFDTLTLNGLKLSINEEHKDKALKKLEMNSLL